MEDQHNSSCQRLVGDLSPIFAVSPAEIAEKLQKARGKRGQPQSHLWASHPSCFQIAPLSYCLEWAMAKHTLKLSSDVRNFKEGSVRLSEAVSSLRRLVIPQSFPTMAALPGVSVALLEVMLGLSWGWLGQRQAPCAWGTTATRQHLAGTNWVLTSAWLHSSSRAVWMSAAVLGKHRGCSSCVEHKYHPALSVFSGIHNVHVVPTANISPLLHWTVGCSSSVGGSVASMTSSASATPIHSANHPPKHWSLVFIPLTR